MVSYSLGWVFRHRALQPDHSRDERSSAPRIALLLAGQLRTLSEQEVLGNLRITILEALRPDVFLSVSLTHTYSWQADYFEALENVAPTNASQLREILHALNPVNISISNDEISRFNGRMRRVPMSDTFLRFRQLLNMVLYHERISGFRYQWVIRTRPDLVYGCSLKSLLHESSLGKKVYVQWDFLAIMSHQAAPLALNLFFEADQFMPCFAFQAELCLSAVLWKHGIPYFDAGVAKIWRPSGCKHKNTQVLCNADVHLLEKMMSRIAFLESIQ